MGTYEKMNNVSTIYVELNEKKIEKKRHFVKYEWREEVEGFGHFLIFLT